ncbi:MAG: Tex-like N-terminal domain-containing protein, partial [Planctomycetota bacterium]
MQPITPQECSRIAQDLQIRKIQVESVVQLLDEGNTVPFITRYRKERTGGLNEDVIRLIQTRVQFLRQLHDRKQTILKTIANQGKLTDELRHAIVSADTTKRLEDLYLPYKPKKKSLATAAREKGLEPLALAVWHSDPAAANLDEMFAGLVNPEKGLNSAEEVRFGVGHILAEMAADSADVRAPVRGLLWETGQVLSVKSDKLPEGQGNEFKNYFQFKETVRQIPPHRILALNRGEKEQALKVHFEWPREKVSEVALRFLGDLLLRRAGQMPMPTALPLPPAMAEIIPPPTAEGSDAPTPELSEAPAPVETPAETPHEAPPVAESPAPETPAPETPAPEAQPVAEPLVASLPTEAKLVLTGEPLSPGAEFKSPHTTFLKAVLEDALTRLVLPSLEREIRNELTEEAEHHAVQVFARNLRSLLLQPPMRGKRVLAIDPGFRTGCKLAALDEYGTLLDHGVMYPFTPPKKRERGPKKVEPKPSPAPSAEASTSPPAEPEPTHVPQTETGEVPAEVPVTVAPPESISPAAEPVVETPAAETAPVDPTPAVESASPAPEDAPVAAEPAAPPPPPVDPKIEAKAKLVEMARKHNVQVIAIGNGTGCRETEEIVSEAIATELPDVAYIIVNEAGASVYSASPVGREEFPTFDATTRGTISIGRRLQDPLSELVKVDPQSIGVGLYQHDMGRKELKESLDAVVESCVNQVGVDLNTASVPLLRHVSGMNQLVARELVDYRTKHGPFTVREQLLQVPNLGPARYTQAAGFLKIPAAPNPLDRTWIHPESYPLAEKILAELNYTPAILDDKAAHAEFDARLRELPIEDTAKKLNAGAPTVYDIIGALLKPGRDPREDLPPPIFKKGILKIEDLQPNMELRGTVLN